MDLEILELLSAHAHRRLGYVDGALERREPGAERRNFGLSAVDVELAVQVIRA